MQTLVHPAPELHDVRPRRLAPLRDEVDRPSVEAVVDDLHVDAGRDQPVVQRRRGRDQLLLLQRRRLPPLEQARAGRADDVDLGAAREKEEQPALDARAGAELGVDLGHGGAAHDGDVDAQRCEALHAAADRRGVGVAAGDGGAVPGEADDRELALERALQRALARPPARVRLRFRRRSVAAGPHRPTILPYARLSCTGTVHWSPCHEPARGEPCPSSTSRTSAASSPPSGGRSTATPPPTSTAPAARRRRNACSTPCSTTW